MTTNTQKRNTVVIIGIGLIVITGLLAALVRLGATQNLGVSVNAENGRDSESLRVTLENAKDAFDAGEALFIDVRNSEQYETSHIPGAVLIPLNSIEGNEPDAAKDTLIFTYCT